MMKSLLAAAVASLIMLASASAGATGPQGGHGGANVNANTNTNQNCNCNDNENKNVNTNNNSNGNSNSNTNSNQNGSRASAQASANASADSASEAGEGGSSSVSIEGDEAPASSAAAVYITTSDDTCMGSSNVGGQADAFGFSVGSTWTDPNCIMLKNARELNAHGHHKAAKARLCMDEENAMAFELAGDPCPRLLPSTQAALAKIRAAGSGSLAGAEPPAQLAMLGNVGGGAGTGDAPADGAGAPDDGGTSGIGDLLAMVHSAVQSVAVAMASAATPDHVSDPYPMDGIE